MTVDAVPCAAYRPVQEKAEGLARVCHTERRSRRTAHARAHDVRTVDAQMVEQPFRLRLTFAEAKRGYTKEEDAAVHITAGVLLDWLPSYLKSDDREPDPELPPDKAQRKRSRKHDLLFAEPYVAELRYHIEHPFYRGQRTFFRTGPLDTSSGSYSYYLRSDFPELCEQPTGVDRATRVIWRCRIEGCFDSSRGQYPSPDYGWSVAARRCGGSRSWVLEATGSSLPGSAITSTTGFVIWRRPR